WSGQAREQAVQRMFTAIARCYDLNNTLLSFGLHHRWKRLTASYVPIITNGRALDIGAGTADLALLIEPKMGSQGHVVASDLNHAMLAEGLRKVAGRGLSRRITCLQANAEQLGFPDDTFHAVTTGFCMRNVGNLMQAFMEIRRVLRPGGRFVCLEFSRPAYGWLRGLYDWYSSARRSRATGRESTNTCRHRSGPFPTRSDWRRYCGKRDFGKWNIAT
ncbi:MAG: ubiE, partial [Nitrospira sp.]|nr:ubiE [Nitrospira sp.]